MTEQTRFHLDQRQDANEPIAAPGTAVISAMTEAALDDPAPAGTVKEGRVALREDEGLPGGFVLRVEAAHARQRLIEQHFGVSER